MEETSETKSEHLSRDTHQDLETPAKSLAVKGTLSKQDISSIGGTTVESGIGHDDSQRVLLLAEGTGVKVEFETKQGELAIRHKLLPSLPDGVCNNLSDITGDNNVGTAHGEQHVQRRTNGGEKQTNGPGTNGVAVATFVNVGNGSPHFRVRGVFHQLDGDAHGGVAIRMHGLVELVVNIGGQVGVPLVLLLDVLDMLTRFFSVAHVDTGGGSHGRLCNLFLHGAGLVDEQRDKSDGSNGLT